MTTSRSPQTLAILPDADTTALAETLVAMANADGGNIVLGYDERGRVVTHLATEDVEGALRQAAAITQPPVRATVETSASAGGPPCFVHVPRSPELHTLADGRAIVRTSGKNRVLTGDEVRSLAANKTTGDYEAESVPGAVMDDFDPAIVSEYIQKREERTRRRVSISQDQLLREIGALDHKNQPTVAGILLFGKNPQAFVPQSGIVFVKFPGVEPRGEGGRVGYGRREEIGGPLARVIERAYQVTMEEMRVGAVVKGLERQEVMEYPEFAVREALVNAVCHRDYRVRGRRIEIRKFADRLEILSPGGLAGYMTLDNIIEEHFSRNPRVVQGLFQWGYIEELGLGVDRMIEDLTAAGHPPPRFNATAYSFSVVMSNQKETRKQERHAPAAAPSAKAATQPAQPVDEAAPVSVNAQGLNERQARAAQYLQNHGRITNRDYQTLCPDVSAETLRLDLADMVDKGVLMRIGEKKGTYYILK